MIKKMKYIIQIYHLNQLMIDKKVWENQKLNHLVK